MILDISSENPEVEHANPSAGMTTKVVKGSLWTLAGQLAPLGFSFIATPFTVRLLGSEAYGVVVLITVVSSYLSFADLGMGVASTKFGAEAYGEGNREKEGEVVRTAALVALMGSLIVAISMFVLSPLLAIELNVPEKFQAAASIGLKIASATFVLSVLATVVNTPMLARLRMDWNSISTTIPKILLIGLTPIVLYFGGGIVGVASTGFFVAVIGIAITLLLSGRLLPELYRLSINRTLLRPMLKLGLSWVVAVVAAVLLVNFDKLVLARMTSVRSLAYYSVAFTFAGATTLFSSAMAQSLVPAFSRLLPEEKKHEFDNLFVRGVRLNLVCLLPGLMVLVVIARPFLTLWAGEEFGAESTIPFYILVFGSLFSVLAYVPNAALVARGRTDALAKAYWIELFFFAVAVLVLTKLFGIVGAASAWSLRAVLDTFLNIWLANRSAGVSLRFFDHLPGLVTGGVVLIPAVIFALFYDNFSPWILLLTPVCLSLYSILIWKNFVESAERTWIKMRVAHFLNLALD